MSDLRERFIETNGVSLHVMESGPKDGPLVMFLHGFPEFWYAWRKQIGYFADKGYLVVTPDQRGYNLSDKPEDIAAYKIDELAKDIIGLIDAYGRDKIFLVGHDWGASVSWWVALKYPERIKKLVIMNVPHPKVMAKNLFGNPRQMQRSWYIFYFQLPGLWKNSLLLVIMNGLCKYWLSPATKGPSPYRNLKSTGKLSRNRVRFRRWSTGTVR